MAQQIPNFYRTTLRAALGVADTQLLLASGTGAALNVITAGNWAYITVSDGMTAEVVKYTSAGNVVNDTITVERAQDGTTAKAFPVGACVTIGWNVGQVTSLINGYITNPVNTMVVVGAPAAAPAANIIYAIDTTYGALWYWTGATWVFINPNSAVVLPTPPASPPPPSLRWVIDSTTTPPSLYYWTDVEWLRLTGVDPTYLEILGRQYLDLGAGIPLAVGTDNPFSTLVTAGMTITTNIDYQSDAMIDKVIEVQGDNTVKILQPCIAEFAVACFGDMDDETGDFRGQLSLFHNADTFQWYTQTALAANSGSTSVGLNTTTGKVQVAADDLWDSNIVVIDGGVTFVGFNLKSYQFTVSVVKLL